MYGFGGALVSGHSHTDMRFEGVSAWPETLWVYERQQPRVDPSRRHPWGQAPKTARFVGLLLLSG